MQGERNDLDRDEAAAAAALERWEKIAATGGLQAVADACSELNEARGAAPLTADELEERRICRALFGIYDPTSTGQASVVREFRERRRARTANAERRRKRGKPPG